MLDRGVEGFSLGVRDRRVYSFAIPKLVGLLRREGVEILHLHSLYAAVPGVVAGRIAGVPLVVQTRHHSDQILQLDRPVHQWLDRVVARAADLTFAVSEGTREVMVKREGTNPAKVRVVWNGIDPPPLPEEGGRQKGREAMGLGLGPLGLAVGRLEAEKGYDTLLDAVQSIRDKVPGFHLLILGEGSLRGRLERRVEEEGLNDAVTFMGFREDVFQIMAVADVLLHPSHSESFGLVLAEAQAMGLPPVATSVGGIPEVVHDGRTGILVHPGDAASLAEGAVRLLTDPGLRDRLSGAGSQMVRNRFTAKAMVLAYEAAYDELLGRRSSVTGV